jgi:hypothetical protein
MSHIKEKHRQALLEKFDKAQKTTFVDQSDRVARKSNGNAFARIGSNGVYYCGRRMNHCNKCCDGHCGTTNGCNCADCQRLTIQARQLPDGFFVNREGYTCRFD